MTSEPFLCWPRIWPWLLCAGLVGVARLTGWPWVFGPLAAVAGMLGLKRWIFWSVEG